MRISVYLVRYRRLGHEADYHIEHPQVSKRNHCRSNVCMMYPMGMPKVNVVPSLPPTGS